MSILKKSREKFRCQQDPNTGFVSCEMVRQVEGGGEERSASVDFSFDSNCRPIPTNLEGDTASLEKLRKSVFPLLKSKCQNIPRDA